MRFHWGHGIGHTYTHSTPREISLPFLNIRDPAMEDPTESCSVNERDGRGLDGNGSDGDGDAQPAWYDLDSDQDADPNARLEDGDEDVVFDEALFEGSYD